MSRKTEETARNIEQNQVLLCRNAKAAIKLPKIFDRNYCVRTPLRSGVSEPLDLKISWRGHAPSPPREGAFGV